MIRRQKVFIYEVREGNKIDTLELVYNSLRKNVMNTENGIVKDFTYEGRKITFVYLCSKQKLFRKEYHCYAFMSEKVD